MEKDVITTHTSSNLLDTPAFQRSDSSREWVWPVGLHEAIATMNVKPSFTFRDFIYRVSQEAEERKEVRPRAPHQVPHQAPEPVAEVVPQERPSREKTRERPSQPSSKKTSSKKRIVLLVLATRWDSKRDATKLTALEKQGYQVYSVDRSPSPDPRHIEMDFAGARGFQTRAWKDAIGRAKAEGSEVIVTMDYAWLPPSYIDAIGKQWFSDKPHAMFQQGVSRFYLPLTDDFTTMAKAESASSKRLGIEYRPTKRDSENPIYSAFEQVSKQDPTFHAYQNRYTVAGHRFMVLTPH
jgi:hypothetical protein